MKRNEVEWFTPVKSVNELIHCFILIIWYIYVSMDNKKIELIAKYIKTIYKPNNIDIRVIDGEVYIHIGFDSIDEKYNTNPYSNQPNKLKERNLESEIRKEVESFFGVKTSGLSLFGFFPYEYHGLTIDVYSNETD